MAIRTKTQFKALYGSAGTLFPDNTTAEISEADIRAFGEDIADSFVDESTAATQDLEAVLTEGNDAGGLQIKNVADGTDPQDAVSKAQLDAAALGIVSSWKAPVKVSTTVAGTLTTSFENGDTVDGVALVTGDRILIKNQATQSENGIYTVNASGAPTRSADANVAAELEGAALTVQQGTSNANTTWIQTTDAVNLGVSNIVFAQLGTSVPDADATTKGIAKLISGDTADAIPVRADVTLANGVVTINWAAADIQNLTITEAKVITTISNPRVGKKIILIIPGTNSLSFSGLTAVIEGVYNPGVENRIYIECLKVSGGAEYRITYDSNLTPFPFSALTDGATVTWTVSSLEAISNRTLSIAGNRTFAIAGAVNGFSGTCTVLASGAVRVMSIPAGTGHKMMGVGDTTVKSVTIPSGETIIMSWLYDGTTFWWWYID